MIGFITVDLTRDSVVDRVDMPIPAGTPPPLLDTYTHGVLLTPDNRELWIAVYATDKVYAFTMPGRQPLADLTVGDGPHWSTLHPEGEPLYVSLERAGEVAAIHRGLRTVQRKAAVGRGPTRGGQACVLRFGRSRYAFGGVEGMDMDMRPTAMISESAKAQYASLAPYAADSQRRTVSRSNAALNGFAT
jgi:hypothetical protein